MIKNVNYINSCIFDCYFFGKKNGLFFIKIYGSPKLTKKELKFFLKDFYNLSIKTIHSNIIKRKDQNKKIFWVVTETIID